jgi:hypothetical protein
MCSKTSVLCANNVLQKIVNKQDARRARAQLGEASLIADDSRLRRLEFRGRKDLLAE